MNQIVRSTLFKTMGLGTILSGMTLAQGHSNNFTYPMAVSNRAQAKKVLANAQQYLDIFNFDVDLKKLDVLFLDLSPLEKRATNNIKNQLKSFQPYELGYFYCVYIRHLHSLNFDLNKDGLVVPWDGKNNVSMDKTTKDYACEQKIALDLKDTQTQRGLQQIYMDYLSCWGHEKRDFQKRIFTVDEAQKFINDVLSYLKIFNYETTILRDSVKDKLSSVQRAEQNLYLIFKDVITQYKDYARKHMRTIALHFLHTKELDWDGKYNIIKWDRIRNHSAEVVSTEQYSGSEVRDMLLPKLQEYFAEASIDELRCIATVCNEWNCK